MFQMVMRQSNRYILLVSKRISVKKAKFKFTSLLGFKASYSYVALFKQFSTVFSRKHRYK